MEADEGMTPDELLKEYALKIDHALADARELAASGEWVQAMSKVNQASWWITASMWAEDEMKEKES